MLLYNKQTITDVLTLATGDLNVSGSLSSFVDATALLCYAIDKSRTYLLTWPEKIVQQKQYDLFCSLLERRINGEPIAYIIGKKEFWSLNLSVSPSTLIPRPDTERLVEVALDYVDESTKPLLDLGTGTGAIALALASELPHISVYGIDFRAEAVTLAQQNAMDLNINNAYFLQSNWFDCIELGTKFALIISNPPYIDKNDPHLKEGDVRFEPNSALIASENGLADIRTISVQAREFLDVDGWLMFEHGYSQAEFVRNILQGLGYQKIETKQDYSGHDRVTIGRFIG